MMDAAKFLEEKDRMCHFFFPKKCYGCPFHEAIQGVTSSTCALREHMWMYDDYVSSVLNWSNTHPRKTKADKFREIFGFDPYVLIDGREDATAFDSKLQDRKWWDDFYKEEILIKS